MQLSAQSSVYLPGIDDDITNWFPGCIQQRSQAQLPMMIKDILNWSWEEIATDFFTVNQKDYLLIFYTFSKYPSLPEIPKKAAETTIPKFQQLFAQYGDARTLFTDNRQPFSSEKFATYMMQQLVQHITLSPHYP